MAVDGYCWLHKAISSPKLDFDTNTGSILNDNVWIDYCLHWVDMLLYYGMEIYLVFDGNYLPGKESVELSRNASRKECLNKGLQLSQSGDFLASRQYFARAVDVSPLMAAKLVRFLRQNRPQVKCIVAPYEADAQLAYLSREGHVDIIIGEDSDTIPYCCREMLFKLDKSGNCDRLLLQDLQTEDLQGLDLKTFSSEMITTMCILAGCDYLVT